MKLTASCALLVVILVAYAGATCPGKPRQTNCQDNKNEGHTGPGCAAVRGTRWYYDRARVACRMMLYKGCGGNGNRYCSKTTCERRCLPL